MNLLDNTVARLRVCRDAGVPPAPDLVDQALDCLESAANARALRSKRDELIRRAALCLGTGDAWTQAKMLEEEAARMLRTWSTLRHCSPDPTMTVRACLHSAALRADLPASRRQYYRILADRGD